jgi:hypothetical protein
MVMLGAPVGAGNIWPMPLTAGQNDELYDNWSAEQIEAVETIEE